MKQPSLHAQILAVNALLITATVLAAVIVTRAELDDVGDPRQALVLGAGILATVLVNGLVLRRRLLPLEHLTATMERVDLAAPGVRAEGGRADSSEVLRLHHAFNRMLARLEDERAQSAGAVLRAQESERSRIARDLHDEVNQALTGVLLRLEATAQGAPPRLRDELRATADLAKQAMDELLRLARELRPAALDDHGLQAALRTQVDRFTVQTGVRAVLELADDLGDLTPEEQIVVYRVVQESLSNIAHHAGASSVRVSAARDRDRPLLRVTDDGRGFAGGREGSLGIIGMRERARLVGGRIDVHSVQGRGTTVELMLEGPR